MANIYDVATLAGVSTGTVSKVMNKPETVSKKTRERVLRAIEELGFVRNASAHQLRAKRSQYIGLIVLDITNPYFTEVARGVEDVISETDYITIFGNTDDTKKKESRYFRILEEQQVQGAIVAPIQGDSLELQRLKEQGMKLVILGQPHKGMCSIGGNDLHGGELAAAHLFALGHRRIGFVHGPVSVLPVVERQRGVQLAAVQAGLDPKTAILDIATPAQNIREGEGCLEQILAGKAVPTALFCANDLLAIGIMKGLAKRGIRVPDDMALVGYDDIEIASLLCPSLTTVSQPHYEAGRTAAELLLDEIQHPETHKHRNILFQPELVIRESSGGARTNSDGTKNGTSTLPSLLLED